MELKNVKDVSGEFGEIYHETKTKNYPLDYQAQHRSEILIVVQSNSIIHLVVHIDCALLLS